MAGYKAKSSPSIKRGTQQEKAAAAASEIEAQHSTMPADISGEYYHSNITLADILPESQTSNARTRFINYTDPLTNIFDESDPRYAEAQSTIDEIRVLKDNLEEVELLSPINVYRSGGKFYLISGHKRFLALYVIKGPKGVVQCRVYREKPKNVEVMRFAENSARSGLSLAATLLSFESAYNAIVAEAKGKTVSVRYLEKKLSASKSKVHLLRSALFNRDVYDAVIGYRIVTFAELRKALAETSEQNSENSSSSPSSRKRSTRVSLQDDSNHVATSQSLKDRSRKEEDHEDSGILLDISRKAFFRMIEERFPEVALAEGSEHTGLVANTLSSFLEEQYGGESSEQKKA